MRQLIFLLLTIFLLSGCDGSNGNIALGTLERDRIAHTATTNEIIVALPVMPGSRVTRGTLLVQLDTTLQQAKFDKAAAEVARALAQLEKLRHGARQEDVAAAQARVSGARAALIESEANFSRLLNLEQKKLISQAEIDKARAIRDGNSASLEAALEALQLLTSGTREEDIQYAEASLKAAEAALRIEKLRLAQLSIISTRDGILDNLPWNLGERVTVGSPLAIVLAGKAPYARIFVPEPYRANLKTGDELRVHVDGLDRTITGKLRWISSDPAFTPYYALNQQERSRLMYLAEVQLPDSEDALPDGVPAQVELP